MSFFELHTVASAPARSAELLHATQQAVGMTPNVYRVLAEQPAALEAYIELDRLFTQTAFTPAEQQLVLLSIAVANECHYCAAAHSTVARAKGLPKDIIEAVRNGQPIEDTRLEALRFTTQRLVTERGWLGTQDLDTFLAAGFGRADLLALVLAAALKTLSNYVNHIAATPLDPPFQAQAWQPNTTPSVG